MAKSSIEERIAKAQAYLRKLHREVPLAIGKYIIQNYPRLSDGKRLEGLKQFKKDYKIVWSKRGKKLHDKANADNQDDNSNQHDDDNHDDKHDDNQHGDKSHGNNDNNKHGNGKHKNKIFS